MTDRNPQPGAQEPDYGEFATRVQSSVERLCAELAESWRVGQRPDLRGYLERLAPEERSLGLIRLLRVELQARRERGEEASEEEYRQQYPEESEAISLAFSTRGQAGVNTEAEVGWSVVTPDPHMFEATQIDASPRVLPDDGKSPWKPGMMLGGFRLERLLGQGGFGEVWKGLDTRLGWEVAIKLLRPKHLNTVHQRTFFEEARKLAALRLQGARVLEVLSADESAGWPYLVTRYLPGGTLRGWMRERPRDWQEASRVVSELAETLQMTHRQQIYHRDIKPENVLLDGAGQVYLADFGLATSEDQQVRVGLATGGTWGYAAPEQCERGVTGGRTDIYALGVLLYEWLTGRLPGPNDRGLHARWLQQPTLRAQPPRELNEDVPEEVQEICLAMLEKDFDQRKITAGDVARRLRGVLAGEPSPAREKRAGQTWVPKVLLGVTAAVLLAAVVTVAIWRSGEGGGTAVNAGTVTEGSAPAAAVVVPGERNSRSEEPLPEAARNLIQPISEFHHSRKWQGTLPVPPGLLNFPGRRDHLLFLVTPDDRKVLLTTAYPQFLPFAMFREKPLQEAQWRMSLDSYEGWCGFFYNWREVTAPQGGLEFMALMMYSTRPDDLPRQIYVAHALWKYDPKAGDIRWVGVPDPRRVFVNGVPPEEFKLTLRFNQGRLAGFLLDDQWEACPAADPPENPVVEGPFGLVLQGGAVQLSEPLLKFQP